MVIPSCRGKCENDGNLNDGYYFIDANWDNCFAISNVLLIILVFVVKVNNLFIGFCKEVVFLFLFLTLIIIIIWLFTFNNLLVFDFRLVYEII